MQFHNIMKPMIQLFMDCKDDFFKECLSLRETCYMRGMAEGAIVVDDIDKLVELSTKPNYVESTKIVKISPFLPIKFKNKTDITMLEFAIACYSNKCFKFLYLKNADDIENEHLHLLECAVKANNFEVIRIIYQSVFISNQCLWDISILQLALKCNRNDLLLWIYNNLTNNRYTDQIWDAIITTAFAQKKYSFFNKMKEESCFISKKKPVLLVIMRGNIEELKYCLNNSEFISIPDENQLIEDAIVSNNIQMFKYIYCNLSGHIKIEENLNLFLQKGNSDIIKWVFFAYPNESQNFFNQNSYSYITNYYRVIPIDKFTTLFTKCLKSFSEMQVHEIISLAKEYRDDIVFVINQVLSEA